MTCCVCQLEDVCIRQGERLIVHSYELYRISPELAVDVIDGTSGSVSRRMDALNREKQICYCNDVDSNG